MNPDQQEKRKFAGDAVSSLLNSVFSIIKGPLLLLLIPLFLSETVQGYWFTFGSLAALGTFADLGFTTIVAQFSAHEYAHLSFNDRGLLVGDKAHLERIISLFRFIVKWAVVVTAVAFPIVFGVGVVVLNTHGNIGDWIIPWVLYVVATGFNFIINSLLSFFEGCGQIGKIQRNRLFGNMVLTATTCALLILKFSLYTLAISALAGVAVNAVLLLVRFSKPFFHMLRVKIESGYKWFKEFMRLIWRYAISWGSGYFIFQIYTPIAFAVYDPALAGKVGITITLIQACFTISWVWLNIVTPRVNMNISKGNWKIAENQIYKNILLSVGTFIVGAACILGGYAIFISRLSILQRFLGLGAMSFLLGAYFLQLPIAGIAMYGRAHKREPFMIPSVINALLGLGITLLCAFTLPIDYLFMGFLLSNIVGLFIFIVMFIKRKKYWNQSYAQKYINVPGSASTEVKETEKSPLA
ncbi:hypothetical protein FACS1894211_07500 [Clostridia bacterium]|nr:hypothetical protein FACS1894211_07500 [Clostridia bacterium]